MCGKEKSNMYKLKLNLFAFCGQKEGRHSPFPLRPMFTEHAGTLCFLWEN